MTRRIPPLLSLCPLTITPILFAGMVGQMRVAGHASENVKLGKVATDELQTWWQMLSSFQAIKQQNMGYSNYTAETLWGNTGCVTFDLLLWWFFLKPKSKVEIFSNTVQWNVNCPSPRSCTVTVKAWMSLTIFRVPLVCPWLAPARPAEFWLGGFKKFVMHDF